MKWHTRKMKTLFKLKDPCIHPACKIYKGVCICGETYIRETIRNVETGWKEHNTSSHKSSSLKHINSHLDYIFSWLIICNAPTNKFKQKIIKPTLTDQLNSDLLYLFRNGLTEFSIVHISSEN